MQKSICISCIAILALAGCGLGGGDRTTVIQAPSPDRPPVTCMARATDTCPLERPETPRQAVNAHAKCAEAWQGCREETMNWRAREAAIEAAAAPAGD